jgi:ribose transport system ATP-binding protein
MEPDAALEVRGITKSFGATKALTDVSMVVAAGTIHGLLGQNGAGKSTLVKIVTGIHGHGGFDGTLLVRDDEVSFDRPQDARRLGIGYVPQEIDVAEHLSVTENVLAGHLCTGLLFRRRHADRVCAEVLNKLGLNISPRAVVATLSAAQRQLLMVARALALDPAVLVLDEPTTSLDDSEASALGAILLELRRTGLAILYITHRVPEVLAICDSATVLRDGKVVEHLAGDTLTATRIVTGMAGRVIKNLFPGRSYTALETVMSVREVGVRPVGATAARVADVSFDLHRGEILGIAGLLGAGRSELLSAIYGAVPRTGTVIVDTGVVRPGHPRFARELGVTMVTEERKREGLLFNLSVLYNITLGSMDKVSVRGLIRGPAERKVGRGVIADLEVKTPRLTSSVEHLSGGNQQKLLIGRALLSAPKIVLLDEPTKGVDVGTRQQIYRLMGSLADQGISLVVISSELDELLGMCDRFLVLAAGKLVDEFVKGEGGETRILAAIAGATDEEELIAR